MTSARRQLRTNLLLLLGVVGAPAAFATMHVAGIGLTIWTCTAGGVERERFPLDLTTAFLTGAAAAVALAAWAAAIFLFFATRGAGNEPPEGRIHYLATLGTALSPLFLFMILMGGLGTIALPSCHQS